MKMIKLKKIKIKALSNTLSVLSFYFYKQKAISYKQFFGIVFLFFGFSVQAQDKCKELFKIEAFSKSMTENLELGKNQRALFDLYRASSFGDSKTFIENSFDDIMDVLTKHPELSKKVFREQEITFGKARYKAPPSLNLFIKRFTGVYLSLKSKLFYISENLYFWKKILGFNQPGQESFARYLEALLSEEERDDLADNSISYKERALFLYQVLDKARKNRIKQGAHVQRLSQVMLDLVHTVGLGDPYHSALLKSKNAIDQLQALHKILSARDAMAMELGFKGHFLELKKALGVSSPSSFSKKEDIYSMLRSIEKETLQSSYDSLGSRTFRLRALSLQESPFRSCLGFSDCSSQTYFFKALDPNFTYWTLTDKEHRSSGQITVVLGEAEKKNSLWKGKRLKVGFVDKIQNVSTEKIEPMLEGIRRSLEEKGYKLGLPKDVGDENGLSNSLTTREYIEKEVNPKLGEKLLKFKPHENSYTFSNGYSRAYDNLSLYEFHKLDLKIEAGEIHAPKKAPVSLNQQDLIDQILSLRSSKIEEDQLRFIKQVEWLYNLKVLSFEELSKDLMDRIRGKEFSFRLRKLSLFNLIELYAFLEKKLSYEEIVNLFTEFSKWEQKNLMGEMSNWGSGNNLNRKDFIEGLFVEREDIHSILKSELLKPLIDPSLKNLKNHAPLVAAIENNQEEIAKLLIEKGINIHSSDLFGEPILILAIKKRLPEIANLLIEKGIDIHILEDSSKKTPLLLAIEYQQTDTAELLIKKGINIHALNDVSGENALMYAIKFNQLKIAKLLIEKGINIHAVDSFGKNAFMYAIQYNHSGLAKLLADK